MVLLVLLVVVVLVVVVAVVFVVGGGGVVDVIITLDCLIILSREFLSLAGPRTGTQEVFLCPGPGPGPGHRYSSWVPVRGPARDTVRGPGWLTGRFVVYRSSIPVR